METRSGDLTVYLYKSLQQGEGQAIGATSQEQYQFLPTMVKASLWQYDHPRFAFTYPSRHRADRERELAAKLRTCVCFSRLFVNGEGHRSCSHCRSEQRT
jgi:hypothetical protein